MKRSVGARNAAPASGMNHVRAGEHPKVFVLKGRTASPERIFQPDVFVVNLHPSSRVVKDHLFFDLDQRSKIIAI